MSTSRSTDSKTDSGVIVRQVAEVELIADTAGADEGDSIVFGRRFRGHGRCFQT